MPQRQTHVLTEQERMNAEEAALIIVDTEDTDVTETLVREMSDADLLEWLTAWDNEGAANKLTRAVA